MLSWLLLLAETAAQDDLPLWGKYVLGPLGALVLLGIYVWRTEKHRIPTLSKLLLTEQGKNEAQQKECEGEKDEIREDYEGRVAKVRDELRVCREKHTKERGLRTWWQAQAQAHGVKEPVPEDIDRTSFSSFAPDPGD